MQIKYKFQKRAAVFLTLISMVFVLPACLKDSGPDTSSIVSALTVIHASPNSPDFEFVLDNQRVKEFSYPDKRINYFSAFSGNRNVKIYEVNRFNSPLYEFDIQLLQGKFYSLFVAGKSPSLTSLLIEDNLENPERGKAKIRFVHVSSDAPALDFKISADSIIASNKKFKEYTGFQDVEPGKYNATIQSHTGDAINLPLELELKEGLIYTVWARGFTNIEEDDKSFGYGLIINNFN